MNHHLSVGDQAPDFTLPIADGGSMSLRLYHRKQAVVLIFYPGDDTPGCTKQLCAIRDDWAKFTRAGVAVFGVNHANADSHTRFQAKHQLPLPLLIDTGKKVSAAYGAIKKFFNADVIKRTVVVIDKDGVIRYLRRGLPPNSEFLPLAEELAK